jgi:hypothetical protein
MSDLLLALNYNQIIPQERPMKIKFCVLCTALIIGGFYANQAYSADSSSVEIQMTGYAQRSADCQAAASNQQATLRLAMEY